MKTKIHFVCRGNVHRSRLAEAYTKSLVDDSWEVSSSGVDAELQPIDFISPWTKILSNEHGLTEKLSKQRTQTTGALLSSQDIVIFMNKDVYRDAKARYFFNDSICEVWDVKDRQDWSKKLSLHAMRQNTYKKISHRVDQLLHEIKRGGWVDAVDEHNNPLGYTLPTSIASKNGVWHRGCHAIITTPDKKILIQKRSKNIVFSPRLIDISLGGHVDLAEDPESATIREIQEEVGLKTLKKDLRFLEIYKQATYHPKYKKYTKAFIYTYHVPLKQNNPTISIQKKEVASVRLLTPNELRSLIKYNRIKHFGRLNYPHAYYKKISELAGAI